MRQTKSFLYLIGVAGWLGLSACGVFQVGVETPATATTTPLAVPSLAPSAAPTLAPVLPTATAAPAASPTPAAALLSRDNVAHLSVSATFGQGEAVRSVAFSPDGTLLATTAGNSQDFSIYLWSVADGHLVTTLSGHSAIVWDLAFSPDDNLLASASSDKTARVWDWRTGELRRSLNFDHEVSSVAFSPDGATLAVGGVDGGQNAAVWTYAVASWQLQRKFSEYWNVASIVYSPDGEFLIGGGTSRNVRVWRPADGGEVAVLYHSAQVARLALSPDGSLLAAGAANGEIWLWDFRSATLINKLPTASDWIDGLAFTPDGSLLFASSREGKLLAYATADWTVVFTHSGVAAVGDLAVSPDGRLLGAAHFSDGKVDVWRVQP